ncbi:hypothetical protein D1AOALGA4SA_3471 [Olavius algarvensis Delta 1 endosymbiont]|nr:hypothetical protein D1AOALGA4SA_3471 [Olavius algarvensis Delta 1 endosymbiont]
MKLFLLIGLAFFRQDGLQVFNYFRNYNPKKGYSVTGSVTLI